MIETVVNAAKTIATADVTAIVSMRCRCTNREIRYPRVGSVASTGRPSSIRRRSSANPSTVPYRRSGLGLSAVITIESKSPRIERASPAGVVERVCAIFSARGASVCSSAKNFCDIRTGSKRARSLKPACRGSSIKCDTPQSSSCSSVPSEKISLRTSACALPSVACSGLVYASVPRKTPCAVMSRRESASSSRYFAIPKSMIFGMHCPSRRATKMLPGLRSR